MFPHLVLVATAIFGTTLATRADDRPAQLSGTPTARFWSYIRQNELALASDLAASELKSASKPARDNLPIVASWANRAGYSLVLLDDFGSARTHFAHACSIAKRSVVPVDIQVDCEAGLALTRLGANERAAAARLAEASLAKSKRGVSASISWLTLGMNRLLSKQPREATKALENAVTALADSALSSQPALARMISMAMSAAGSQLGESNSTKDGVRAKLRALELHSMAVGSESPDLASTLMSTIPLVSFAEPKDVLKVAQQMMDVAERVSDVDQARSLFSLAETLLKDSEQTDDLVGLLWRRQAYFEAKYGARSSEALVSLKGVADFLFGEARDAKAEQLRKCALLQIESAFGRSSREYEEAEASIERAVANANRDVLQNFTSEMEAIKQRISALSQSEPPDTLPYTAPRARDPIEHTRPIARAPARKTSTTLGVIDRLKDSNPEKASRLVTAAFDIASAGDDATTSLALVNRAERLMKGDLERQIASLSLSRSKTVREKQALLPSELHLHLIAQLYSAAPLQNQPLVDEALEVLQWRPGIVAAQALVRSAAHVIKKRTDQASELEELAIAWKKTAIGLIEARNCSKPEIGPIYQLARELQAVRSRFKARAEALNGQTVDVRGLIGLGSITANDIRRRLRPREAFLAFAFGKERPFANDSLWVVLITDSSAKVIEPWAGRPLVGLQRAVQKLQSALASEDAPFDFRNSHEIYKTLIGPLDSYLQDIDRLVIVPDPTLASVPFPALVETLTSDGKSGRWLVDRYATTTALSINSFFALRSLPQRTAAIQPFVGFANPTIDGHPTCPKSSLWGARRNGSSPRAAIRTDILCPEAKTMDHVRQLAQGLQVDPNTAIFSGPALTKENIAERLGVPVRVVAFATHGLLNTEALREAGIPEPALLLSRSMRAGVTKNEFLSMSEIELLKIDADLVVLSACNTAADDGESGGYFSGLARAFFEAGARSILVTNWPVNAASVANLLALVSQRGLGAPEAPLADILREAMISQRAIFEDPRDWAMFTYIGR